MRHTGDGMNFMFFSSVNRESYGEDECICVCDSDHLDLVCLVQIFAFVCLCVSRYVLLLTEQ